MCTRLLRQSTTQRSARSSLEEKLAHLYFIIALLAVSWAFARLEIEIEGDRGWASGLPTWKLENRWTRLALGERPLTGYHLWAHVVILLLVHLPYALTLTSVSVVAELRILAFLVLFWILEDFLWFVLNPSYGLRRFTRAGAPWHAGSWWIFMPREYWIFLPVGVWLYAWSWIR